MLTFQLIVQQHAVHDRLYCTVMHSRSYCRLGTINFICIVTARQHSLLCCISYRKSVRPSDWPSVTRWYQAKTTQATITGSSL